MVSALDSGASGPGSSLGQEHCVVFLSKTVPLSTQVYKWVLANCWGNLTNCGGVTCNGLASRPGEVEILLAASCYRNRDKHRQLQYESVLAPRLHFYLSTKTNECGLSVGVYNNVRKELDIQYFHIMKMISAQLENYDNIIFNCSITKTS